MVEYNAPLKVREDSAAIFVDRQEEVALRIEGYSRDVAAMCGGKSMRGVTD